MEKTLRTMATTHRPKLLRRRESRGTDIVHLKTRSYLIVSWRFRQQSVSPNCRKILIKEMKLSLAVCSEQSLTAVNTKLCNWRIQQNSYTKVLQHSAVMRRSKSLHKTAGYIPLTNTKAIPLRTGRTTPATFRALPFQSFVFSERTGSVRT